MRRERAEERDRLLHLRLEELGREFGRIPERETDPEEDVGDRVAAPGRHSRGRPPSLPAGERDGFLGQVAWFAAAVRLRPAHVAVLLTGAVLVIGCAGLAMARTTPEEVPAVRTSAPTSTSPGAAGLATTPSAAATASATSVVVVDVAGKVRRPGVLTLPAGSRVIDAIRAAGGALRDVNLAPLNQARVLADGEQIVVGAKAPAAAPASGAAAASPQATVPLNVATAADLEALPGIGPVTAEKIVAWRDEHGPFTAIDELLEVDGIGPKTLTELTAHLTL